MVEDVEETTEAMFYCRGGVAFLALLYVIALTTHHTYKLLTRDEKIKVEKKRKRTMSASNPTSPRIKLEREVTSDSQPTFSQVNSISDIRTAGSINPLENVELTTTLASASPATVESPRSAGGLLPHEPSKTSSKRANDPSISHKSSGTSQKTATPGDLEENVPARTRGKSNAQQKIDSLKKHIDLSHIFVYGSLCTMGTNYIVNLIDFIPPVAGMHCLMRHSTLTISYLYSHLFVFLLFIRRIQTTFKGS